MQLVRNLYTGDARARHRGLQAQDPRGEARRGARGPSTPAARASAGSSRSTSTTCRTARSAARPRSASRPPRASSSTSPPASSTLHEAALLAGLPQAPSHYNPFLNPSARTARRNDVLRRMADEGYITRRAGRRGQAPRPRRRATRLLHASSARATSSTTSRQQLIDEYGLERVRQGGLRIYTTLDLELQRAARKALDKAVGGTDRAARDRLDRPEQRPDPGDGLDRHATASSSSTSPRRASTPPGSTFKIDGADGGAAPGRRPRSARATRRCR